MAIINVDDAYILNETGAEVDKVTGLFTKDESTTSGEKSQARFNIGAGGSNRNLLDNWYFVGGGSQLGDGIFPINQRGQASYPSISACIDRWKTDGGFTLSSSGISQDITLAAYQMATKDFIDRLYGKTLTMSMMLTDGTIKSGTFTMPSAYTGEVTVLTAVSDGSHYIGLLIYDTGIGQICRMMGNNIAAVKLELGTVSTLANDPPPDFGEELRKCQRYLWIEKFPANTVIGSGLTFNTNTIYDIVTPVAMRTGGTITMTASTSLYVVYNATYALAGVVNGISSHGNHLRVSMDNNGGNDYGTLNHADLLVSYETVVVVANEL